jgi:hypothetical protein
MKPRYVADAIGKGGVVRSRYEQTGEYVVVDNVPKLVWTDRVLGGKYYQGVSDMMVVYNATLDNTVLDREQMKEMYPEYII